MSGEPSARETWTWRVSFSVFSFLFNTGMLIVLYFCGNGQNPIHNTMKHYSYVINIAILSAMGAAAMAPEILDKMKK